MRWLPRALATTTACLLLAGCGGNPTPAPPPNATGSPSASASASPTPPALPAAAKEKTKAGAVSFVRAYVTQLNYAGETGDVSRLVAMASPTCVRCKALSDGIKRVYDSGGSIRGGGWTVVNTKSYGFERGRYFLDVAITSTPQVVREAANGPSKSFPGSKGQLRSFVLERRQQGWRVSELDPTA